MVEKMEERYINLDHASGTRPLPEVVQSIRPYLDALYGNPSSLHSAGQQVKEAVDNARQQTANLINASADEIVFTSSGSESNNFALKGAAFANRKKGDHIVVSAIEHFSVLQAAKSLTRLGYQVTQVPVDNNGLVDPDDVKKAITDKTILVSVMHANHEIGTIQEIEEIAVVVKERDVLFHVDAIQTIGTLPVDINKINADLMSFAAQNFYGPKGCAGLYIRKGTRINPLIDGGTQEGGRRAGTENVAGIIGTGTAAELAARDMPGRIKHVSTLRDLLIKAVEEKIEHVYLHGHRSTRLPNNINFGFEFIEGESILLFLGTHNILASSGSACTSHALKASHVLMAIGVSHAIANGTILFTPGIDNTVEDVNFLVEKLEPIVKRLREMSPLYK